MTSLPAHRFTLRAEDFLAEKYLNNFTSKIYRQMHISNTRIAKSGSYWCIIDIVNIGKVIIH